MIRKIVFNRYTTLLYTVLYCNCAKKVSAPSRVPERSKQGCVVSIVLPKPMERWNGGAHSRVTARKGNQLTRPTQQQRHNRFSTNVTSPRQQPKKQRQQWRKHKHKPKPKQRHKRVGRKLRIAQCTYIMYTICPIYAS